MISAAVGRGGETLISAQTTEAFWNAVKHVKPLSVGLNCSLGPDLMYPFLEELSEKADVAISCYPNAGLPNPLSETGFDLGPPDMARYLGDFARAGLINIAGGCCGNTPEHIAAIAKALEGKPPRAARIEVASVSEVAAHPSRDQTAAPLRLAALHPAARRLHHDRRAHQRRRLAQVRRLVKEGKFEEAVSVARQQVENGANVIDICMDEGMIDGVAAMTRYLQLLASEPEVAKVPFMVDSSKWEVIEAGLKCLQGKGIVNSISLKEGEAKFRQNAATVLKYGAAVVVMAFDEQGQAATYDEKIRICERAYRILVDEVGFPPKTSSSTPTSSPSPPAWRSTTTTPSTSSTPRAGSRPTCRTPRSPAASPTSPSAFAATTRSARPCTRPFSITPSPPAWTWASSTPACSKSTKRSSPN
jgi:5-methyltetrahydrofolate--homocysteine methyltransferase